MSKKEALVEFAFRELLNSDSGDISLNEIIKKSGVAKGTFYHHFKNKDELIKAIVEQYLIGAFSNMSVDLESSDISPKEKLDSIFEKLGQLQELLSDIKPSKDRMRSYFSLFGRILHKYDYLHKGHVDSKQEFLERILKVIKDGQEDGSFTRKYSAEKLTNFMVALVQGTFAMGIQNENYSLEDSQMFIGRILENTEEGEQK